MSRRGSWKKGHEVNETCTKVQGRGNGGKGEHGGAGENGGKRCATDSEDDEK